MPTLRSYEEKWGNLKFDNNGDGDDSDASDCAAQVEAAEEVRKQANRLVQRADESAVAGEVEEQQRREKLLQAGQAYLRNFKNGHTPPRYLCRSVQWYTVTKPLWESGSRQTVPKVLDKGLRQ